MLTASINDAITAARANLIPGIILWLISLLLLGAYYYMPTAKFYYDIIGELKSSGGYIYSILATALFGGLIPALFSIKILSSKSISVKSFLIFSIILWGYRGLEVDLLYQFQSHMFGDTVSVNTILKKVAFDQFVYTMFWAAPLTVVLYLWKDCQFNFRQAVRRFEPPFIFQSWISLLISTWLVWIPSVAIIYSLPPLLQIPLFNLVLCFYVCLITYLTAARNK